MFERKTKKIYTFSLILMIALFFSSCTTDSDDEAISFDQKLENHLKNLEDGYVLQVSGNTFSVIEENEIPNQKTVSRCFGRLNDYRFRQCANGIEQRTGCVEIRCSNGSCQATECGGLPGTSDVLPGPN